MHWKKCVALSTSFKNVIQQCISLTSTSILIIIPIQIISYFLKPMFLSHNDSESTLLLSIEESSSSNNNSFFKVYNSTGTFIKSSGNINLPSIQLPSVPRNSIG